MLERMEDLILAGVAIPLTPWTIIHGDKLVPLLDRIRESLPDEVRSAQQLVQQRDDMLEGAQRKAQMILDQAKSQAESILSESELMKAVHQEADQVRDQLISELESVRNKAYEEAETTKTKAVEEAKRVRAEADEYAEVILSSLDKSLVEFQAAIRDSQKQMKRTKVETIMNQQGMSKKGSTTRYSAEARGEDSARRRKMLEQTALESK